MEFEKNLVLTDLSPEEAVSINGGGRIWRKIKRRISNWANSIGDYFAHLFGGAIKDPWNAPTLLGQRDYPNEDVDE